MAGARKLPPRETAKLDRTTIVEAAFAVLSEKGLDGLSLRVLASHLGVQAPALYWHVRNKAELLGMMAATFGEVAARAESREKTWAARLIAYGHALRQAMLLHRDAARLCAIARPIEPPEENANRVAAPLIAAGLDVKRALSYQASVIAYTLGWVVYEQSQPMHEHLAQMLDLAQSFESGLRAMVRGFVAEVEDTAPKRAGPQPRLQRRRAKSTRA